MFDTYINRLARWLRANPVRDVEEIIINRPATWYYYGSIGREIRVETLSQWGQ